VVTNNDIEKRLWAAADQLWANSNLKPSEFSTPVLGLIFLRYADHKFTKAEAALPQKTRGRQSGWRLGKTDCQAERGLVQEPASKPLMLNRVGP
jgi:type I restriction enzyme M protein